MCVNSRKSRLEVARRLDPICDRFEEDWLAGRHPQIEEFLDRVPQAERPALLGDLRGETVQDALGRAGVQLGELP
jgi:hypothetical protein